MSSELNMVSEFYQATRCSRSTTKMMSRTFVGIVILCAWSGLTPVNETVVQVVTIVPNMVDQCFDSVSQNPDATVSGKASEICVTENDVVRKGQLILRIDSEETVLKIESLQKQIAAARKDLELEGKRLALQKQNYVVEREGYTKRLKNAQVQISLSRKRRDIHIKQARVGLDLATRSLRRGKKLKSQNAVSQLELDQMSSAYANAREELAMASIPVDESGVDEIEASLKSLQSGHELKVHEANARAAGVANEIERMNSDKRILERTLDQCEIRSPCDGIVTCCEVKVGDWIGPGELPITISPEGFMVEAVVPSNSIGSVAIGNSAVISIDGIDWMLHGQMSGTVASVSSDVVHDETVTGNGLARPLSGYRVLIELSGRDGFDAWDRVRLGMTGSAEIQTGRKKLAVYLFEKAFGKL